ncbi:hypothetical protein J2W42_004914 [Rhizobium tibeticum]|nr:hypothetical protein [Rhizobium tibeticum]
MTWSTHRASHLGAFPPIRVMETEAAMSRMPPCGKGLQLNKPNTFAAPAASPRERDDAARCRDKNWKPYPCLLTRRELQELIAQQLG